VLGATKRLAELVLQAHSGSSTVLSAVRFGNVLGSRGSLLHVIRDQLAHGSEVTVTDPEVTRFFMTIEEAVGLVLEAARMADGTATYVLDMGEPVKIVDLVSRFAHLLSVPEVTFRFTGLRPGEKLNEELFGDGEDRRPTAHTRISMTRPPMPKPGFRANLQQLYDAATHNRADEVKAQLRDLVPEYLPPAPLERALVGAGIYPDDY
jgi:FlaA1/EpsC-like NDP-sugar epimerase